MLIDSHCHLDRVDLKPYGGDFSRFMAETRASGLDHLLCVAIDLESYPKMRALVEPYPWVFVSIGLHPNESGEVDADGLAVRAQADARILAIGETGLDYYRCEETDRPRQREQFRRQIAAARQANKPLIVHTRAAREDTLRILREEEAESGVLHCFTETWEMARQGLDLGFYISFSGILSFRNAAELREVAKRVPLDRLLIETDSPYLAPVPYRGKPNEPKYVQQVAECLAALRGLSLEALAEITKENFFRLFQRSA